MEPLLLKQFPKRAQITVIGGGIVGCSTAYHLLSRGWKDVVVVEKAKLTSGTTWHAAGAVGQLRRSSGITQMIGYSVGLYGRLEKETGLSTGWKQCGSIRLACTPERLEELERSREIGQSIGLDFQMISLDEVKAKLPVVSLEGVLAAGYISSDGMISPTDVTMSLAKGVRLKGGLILEDAKVTGFDVKNGRVTAVETELGAITCDKVVLCGGIWARELGRLAGVNIPIQANHDQYAISDVIPGLERNSPNLRDPDNHIYFKEEVGGFAFGSYDQHPIAFDVSQIPDDCAFHLFEPDIDHFAPTVDDAVKRIPALANVGIKRFIHGLESFTEDSMPIMGEAPELRDFYVACGFNGFGIASGGGAGKALADWVTDGRPGYDLCAADIRRFGPHHGSNRMVRALALDGQRRHYALERSGDEPNTARQVRRSPVYPMLASGGASFKQVIGWETAEYFSVDRQKDAGRFIDEEFAAAKQSVVLVDDSARAKFAVLGPKAKAILKCLLPHGHKLDPGQVATSYALNSLGGIECNLTIAVEESGCLMLATAAERSKHLETHLIHDLKLVQGVDFLNTTSRTAVLMLIGPLASSLLGDAFEGALPKLGKRSRGYIAGAPANLASKGQFRSALFEIELPTEYAAYVFEYLQSEGAAHGLKLAGSRAVEKLRVEMGSPAFGREIDANTKLWQITPSLFSKQQTEPALKHMFLEGNGYQPCGHEGILHDNQRVGVVTSAVYSPVSNGSFVLALVNPKVVDETLHVQGRKGSTYPLSSENFAGS